VHCAVIGDELADGGAGRREVSAREGRAEQNVRAVEVRGTKEAANDRLHAHDLGEARTYLRNGHVERRASHLDAVGEAVEVRCGLES